MRYRKLGLIYAPDGSDPLGRAYAILPTPMLLGDIIRVFYASTDDRVVGRIFFVDLAADDPRRIIRRSVGPVLDAGEPGTFDQHGVNPVSLVRHGRCLRLYYAGYQRPEGLPYTLFTGLAESQDDGLTFTRVSRAPVLDRTHREPFFRTAAHVRPGQGGYDCWYIGGDRWVEHDKKLLPIYGLRRAWSVDGIEWDRGRVLLEPDESAGQIGFGRPYLLGDRLFLSLRTVNGYSISHAIGDGENWRDWRHDVLPRSESGWDAEMTCYAAPLVVGREEYVFYNGNRFGKTGFGVAIRES
jgi:hypothetical protein